MSLQLTIVGQLNISDGAGNSGGLNISKSETPAGVNEVDQRQSIPTSWTALNVGLTSPPDWLMVVNNDPTNYVQLATDNAGAKIFSKIKPGRFALLPADPSVTYYAKANVAACIVAVAAVEA
jgi:hypothetical protein